MFIRKLKPGEQAGETSDRIYVDRLEGGRVTWTGLVDVAGKAIRGNSPDAGFATVQEAETDAIEWARGHGATDLQIQGPNS